MGRRSPVAVMVLSGLALAGAPAGASAQESFGTVDQAAAKVAFPVFEVTRTLGYLLREAVVVDYSEVRACPRADEQVEAYYEEQDPVQGRKPRWLFVGWAAEAGVGARRSAAGRSACQVLGQRVLAGRGSA